MKLSSKIAAVAALTTLLLTSCGTPKKMIYLEEYTPENLVEVTNSTIKAQPNDELLIIVNSKDPELSAIFNLPVISSAVGRNGMSYNQEVATYTVNEQGDINFPILGNIHVEGLTRGEIAATIEEKLKAASLLTDPVVVVNFMNPYFSVTGEVNRPGRFLMDRDEMTVLDAISAAGDLTIYGNRPNVKVMRNVNGKPTIYEVDLTDVEKLTSSPAFFIQQNDVVYVTPNATRTRQSTVNGNNLISYSFWLSLASVLTSIAVLIFK